MEKFNLSRYQLRAIFHCAGAPEYPFGVANWWKLPFAVLDNIRYIETYPPQVYSWEDYYDHPDVKEWLKIEKNRIAMNKLVAV